MSNGTSGQADTPYVLDIPDMTGDVNQTLATLRGLRLTIIQAGPKPNYNIHGESMSWEGLMRWFDMAIMQCQKEAVQLQPFEIVSIAR
jgi:hypothetical protein